MEEPNEICFSKIKKQGTPYNMQHTTCNMQHNIVFQKTCFLLKNAVCLIPRNQNFAVSCAFCMKNKTLAYSKTWRNTPKIQMQLFFHFYSPTIHTALTGKTSFTCSLRSFHVTSHALMNGNISIDSAWNLLFPFVANRLEIKLLLTM